ncbi:hypothetical protein ACSBR2_009351 [Camellia fascicularis]
MWKEGQSRGFDSIWKGKKSNCLAIHLQHLSSLPKSFQLQEELNGKNSSNSNNRKYYKKVKWKSFSHVIGDVVVKAPTWDGSSVLAQKSGIISTLISMYFSMPAQKPPPCPSDININFALYLDSPSIVAQAPKLLRFIDTTKMTRGPQDPLGYWVVSGARLVVDKSKISLHVKYSLLTVTVGLGSCYLVRMTSPPTG